MELIRKQLHVLLTDVVSLVPCLGTTTASNPLSKPVGGHRIDADGGAFPSGQLLYNEPEECSEVSCLPLEATPRNLNENLPFAILVLATGIEYLPCRAPATDMNRFGLVSGDLVGPEVVTLV